MDSGQVSTYSSFNHPLCGRLFILPFPRNLSTFAICCPLRGMLVDNYACWCQEYFLATHGRDYSPSTSVDLEREGVVVVFGVVEFRASKSALGVGPKAPTSEVPVQVTQLHRAGVLDGSKWQPLGPPCRRPTSSLPQRATATSSLWSTCRCCSLKTSDIFDVEIDLARSGGLEDMEVVNIKPLRFWPRCDHAGCTTC